MAQSVAVDGVDAAGARPTVSLPIGHIVRISLYWMGLTAIDGAVGVFVQNRLLFGAFRVDDLMVGRISSLLSLPGAIISILIQPTVGSISDYTVSRWGRRKPYIVFGSVIDLIFLFGMATSNSILMLGSFWALLSVSTNIARGPFQGYVPDLIAERQVGMASPLVGLVLVVVANLVVIIPSARLSDRIGRKPVIFLSCAVGFAGVGLAAIAPVVPLAIVGATLFGASAGMFLAVDWALMTDIIPRV